MTEPSEIAFIAADEIGVALDFYILRPTSKQELRKSFIIAIQSAIDKATAGMVRREDVLPLTDVIKWMHFYFETETDIHGGKSSREMLCERITTAVNHTKEKGLM